MLEDLIKRLKDFEVRLKDVCVFPALQPDERYAGIVVSDEGEPGYHLIVIDSEIDYLPAGVKLPTYREMRLVSANMPLKHTTYWCTYSGSVRVVSDGWKLDVASMTSKFGIMHVRRVPV